MKLFEELHRAGHTIVLVTHEPKLAARCPRAVRLSDGKVIGDGVGSKIAYLDVAQPAAAAEPAAVTP